MGNQPAQNTKNFQFDLQYGEHVVQENQVIKKYHLTSTAEDKSFKALMEMYKRYKTPTILPILKSERTQSEQSDIFQWKLHFKYLQKTLQEQIQQRISQSKRYTEQEIMKAVDCILAALIALQFNNLYHGHISCETIFVDPDPLFYENNESSQKAGRNLYVIGFPLLLNPGGVQRLIKENRIQKLYLSPQNLIQLFNSGKVSKDQKSDIYSLGLVLLRMATFCDIAELYDYKNLTIKQKAYSKRIYQCRQLYSQKLCDFLLFITEKQSIRRPDYQKLYHKFTLLNENGNEQNNSSVQASERRSVQREQLIPNSSEKKNSSPKKQAQLIPRPICVRESILLQALPNSFGSKLSWKKFKARAVAKAYI